MGLKGFTLRSTSLASRPSLTEKQMYLTSKRLGVLPEGASFGKADKGTETE